MNYIPNVGLGNIKRGLVRLKKVSAFVGIISATKQWISLLIVLS